ncbi:MAG TPA: hypothetical protein VLY63_02515 [Anaerolineae bacterium]|nr:hypothetical protein [Anaerolineae bacterium]
MTPKKGETKKKISTEFAARLRRYGPEEKVHAIVFLATSDVEGSSGKRQSREERAAVLEAMQNSARQALDDIDTVLNRFDGQRLAETPSALGSIPVETTPAGIKALASSKWVQLILEDQPIHPT